MVNILILSLMTAFYPVTYGVIPYTDPSGDFVQVYESCIFTTDHRHKFWIPLICWNIAILVYSLLRSWSARNCELEESATFPSERPQIFHTLLSCLVVSLLGIMVMQMIRDRGDPITSALVDATISFFFCILVLFIIFSPKMKHVWRTFSRHPDETHNDIPGDDYETESGLLRDSHHLSTSSHSPTKEELKAENDGLRKRNVALEKELILSPRSVRRSKNQILTNFFGSFLGGDDNFEDEYTLTPTIEQEQPLKQLEEEDIAEKQQEQGDKVEKFAHKPPRFTCKKIVEDILFVSSDIIPSFSPDIRPMTISAKTTSWSLGREYKSFKSSDNFKSSTSSSNNKKSSYQNSSIYKTSPNSTNKTSPESKNKSSPETKSTPTLSESDLKPNRSSFYKSPIPKRRGPEVEDYSSTPLERNKDSFGSSMAPLIGSPLTPIAKYSYNRNSLAFSESPPENISKPKSSQGRKAARNSFDSSMMPLGDPSVTPSLSTGMDPRSIFRTKRHSGGLDSYLQQQNDKSGGIPSFIFVRNYETNEEDLTQQTAPMPSTPEALPAVLAPPPPALPRRPSLGYDVAIPKDPQNRYRHCV